MSRILSKERTSEKILIEKRLFEKDRWEKHNTNYSKVRDSVVKAAASNLQSGGCRSQICEFSHSQKQRQTRPASCASQHVSKSPAKTYRSLLGGRAAESFMDQPLSIRRNHSSFSLHNNAVQTRQKEFFEEAQKSLERKRKQMDSATSKRQESLISRSHSCLKKRTKLKEASAQPSAIELNYRTYMDQVTSLIGRTKKHS